MVDHWLHLAFELIQQGVLTALMRFLPEQALIGLPWTTAAASSTTTSSKKNSSSSRRRRSSRRSSSSSNGLPSCGSFFHGQAQVPGTFDRGIWIPSRQREHISHQTGSSENHQLKHTKWGYVRYILFFSKIKAPYWLGGFSDCWPDQLEI